MHMLEKAVNREEIKGFYKTLNMDYVFESIFAGNTPASFYVDSLENPTLSILIQKNTIYLGGEPVEEDTSLQVFHFLKEMIAEKKKIGPTFLKGIYTSKKWKELIEDWFKELEFYEYGRSLYQHNLNDLNQPSGIQDIELTEIHSSLFTSDKKNVELVADEVSGEWGSVEGFLTNGFGICAMNDKEVIGWCTAEFMSANACGIGIEVIEGQQRQGIATSMTQLFLKKCKELEITPHWDSWQWNKASIKVAEKSSFQKVIDYPAIMLRVE